MVKLNLVVDLQATARRCKFAKVEVGILIEDRLADLLSLVFMQQLTDLMSGPGIINHYVSKLPAVVIFGKASTEYRYHAWLALILDFKGSP